MDKQLLFTTLVMAQLIHVFDCRSEKSVFDRNPFENLYLVLAVVSSILLLLVVVYWAPLQPVFHTMSLGLRDWMLVLGLAALPTVLFGFTKITYNIITSNYYEETSRTIPFAMK